MYFSYVNSPVGDILIAGDEEGLKQVNFSTGKRKTNAASDWIRDDGKLKEAREQIQAYFKGQLKEFKLKLCPNGTAFQKDVLKALQKIPYGATRSYSDIANAVGKPKACRAVGGANGRNPLAIVIPCHRVIGASGDLTGFGGGLSTKKILLDLEKRYSQS
ncbi:MAG: methylated-DNA--[protein]-cysteine S-methyltransferase [Candidatus Omnitrophica bacterium]|nr:methylated-DNA--[protein]-cysteine S-methyltransferase [Candidatus Omnitrophota bacterium]